MIAGYHTAGLLLHDVCAAVSQLARMGYRCVAIRPHAASLNPQLPDFGQRLLRLADALSRAEVRSVIDVDALFLHDSIKAHGPSLASADDRECRLALEWVQQWLAIADELGSDLVTFASGEVDRRGHETEEHLLERLAAQLAALLEGSRDRHVRLALRPRSGDAIATVAHFERLGQWLDEEHDLLLAADIGEMLLGSELPVVDRLLRNRDALACVYLCDRRAGKVGDQRIGQGDVALVRILRSLDQHGFDGPAIIRIEGHSELGFTPAREAIQIFAEV